MWVKTHVNSALYHSPEKEQSCHRSVTKSDLFGADQIRLSCLQSPAETDTLAGGKDSRAPLNLPYVQRAGMSPTWPHLWL